MGAMNSSQIEIKCLANGMGPYMECMPTFVWNKCGGELCLAIPGSEGHSFACAWNMGVFLWVYKQFQVTL